MKSTSVLTSTNRNLTKPNHNLLLLLQPQNRTPKNRTLTKPHHNPQNITPKQSTTNPPLHPLHPYPIHQIIPLTFHSPATASRSWDFKFLCFSNTVSYILPAFFNDKARNDRQ